MSSKPRHTRLARRVLNAYQWAKRMGYPAVAHAHFQMTAGKRGAANLLGQSRVRMYDLRYWNRRNAEK